MSIPTPDFDPPYLVVGRAAGDRDGACVEMKLHDAKEILDLEDFKQYLTTMFKETFPGEEPRVAVVILPWTTDDADDE